MGAPAVSMKPDKQNDFPYHWEQSVTHFISIRFVTRQTLHLGGGLIFYDMVLLSFIVPDKRKRQIAPGKMTQG